MLFVSICFKDLQGIGAAGYPGSTFPAIDKINLALWQTLGYVFDPVFQVYLFMSELEE